MPLRVIYACKARLVIVLQEEGANMSARDIGVVERQTGINHVTADHAVWLGEVMLIVRIGAAESDHGCDGVAAPTGSSGPLLVVGSGRRHIAERDAA